MGDWGVLKYWNPSADSFHEWTHGHRGETPVSVMKFFNCWPAVEQHQEFTEEFTPPEFTIAVSYRSPSMASAYLGSEMSKPGWKWSICWTSEKGERKMCTGYGFQTPDQAKRAAEHKADQIALSFLPEEVYTYTPEMR